MSGLEYISSAGLRVLLVVAKKVQQAKGKMVLFGLVPNVREVFSVSGFDKILAIQTDQKLLARNSDQTAHNVHPIPAVPGNKEENRMQPAKAPDLTFVFSKPESFLKIKCDVHPFMFAWVSVFDHPYFAVTAKDGSFKIPNLPAGKYTIEAYHLKAGAKSQEITVGADEKKTASFELEAPAPQ